MAASCLVAQPREQGDVSDTARKAYPRYGGFAHLLLNIHRAGFSRLPGIPNCCQEFTGGSGVGFSIGGLVAFPISDPFWIEGRVGYALFDGSLVEEEETTVIVDGEATTGAFEHQLDAGLPAITVQPLLSLRLGGRFRLRAGGEVAWLLGKSYDQREVLVRPEETGVFENGRRTRNEFAGDIPNAPSMLTAFLIGAGVDFPLNERGSLNASPEIFYSHGLTSLVADSNWYVSTFRVGVAVTYSSVPDAPPVIADVPPQPPTDTSLGDEPVLEASVRAVGILDDGTEVPVASLRVEEFISTHMRPLLNYVFFAEGDSTIPERYERLNPAGTTAFAVENLHGYETLPTYYHLLNIVGRRLTDRPGATITLTGTNDGGAESATGGEELSRRRAENVARYLRDVWRVDPSRIRVESRGLPSVPSNQSDPDGIEENRRVEITSNDWEILAPVVTEDTLRRTNPPRIRFVPNAISERGIDRWSLRVRQEGKRLKEFSGSGEPNDVDWIMADDAGAIPRSDLPLEYDLTVTDRGGGTLSTIPGSLPVEQVTISRKRRDRIADRYIDRYSLILFEFDRAEVTGANQRIADFILNRLTPASQLAITGYTDRIGQTDYNARLSLDRARMTADALERPDATVTAVGEQSLIYDNDLPEGRFYSRTVTVVAETPVESE